MGMFQPATTGDHRRLDRQELVHKVSESYSDCRCGTRPEQHVIMQYKQSAHCPRCGRVPTIFKTGGK